MDYLTVIVISAVIPIFEVLVVALLYHLYCWYRRYRVVRMIPRQKMDERWMSEPPPETQEQGQVVSMPYNRPDLFKELLEAEVLIRSREYRDPDIMFDTGAQRAIVISDLKRRTAKLEL